MSYVYFFFLTQKPETNTNHLWQIEHTGIFILVILIFLLGTGKAKFT